MSTESITEIIKDGAAEDAYAHLVVNPELESYLDSQSDETYADLKASIEKEGIRDPLAVWKDGGVTTVIGGHTRLKIAKELGLFPVPTVEIKGLADLDAVKQWMIRDQLARRNLTELRLSYWRGKLYNEQKKQTVEEMVTSTDGIKTDEKLAQEHGVSARTIRRDGDTTKGIDQLEKVRGKLAKTEVLSGKGAYTKDELATVGKAPNTAAAKKTLSKLDEKKATEKAAKQDQKATKAKVEDKQTYYKVAMVEPDFSVSNWTETVKPSLDKDAAVYMVVPDWALESGLKLFDKWGLKYAASFIFYDTKATDTGAFSKIIHQFVLVGEKGGTLAAPVGKEPVSCQPRSKDLGEQIAKIIDGMVPAGSKKLDMRRAPPKPLPGWDTI